MAKRPCARNLRFSVTLQAETQVSDGGGGFTTTWSTVATVKASIEPLKGNERFRAQQLENPVSHRMWIRYRADVTGANRILYDSRTFNIHAAIDPDERKRWLRLEVEEGVAT